MHPAFRACAATALVALAIFLPGRRCEAQQALTVPQLDWRTIDTPHFRIMYPASASTWTHATAARLESVYAAVSSFVRHAPSGPITLVIDDPSGASNGFAVPFLDGPVIFFWPTPPSPASGVGESPGWGAILSVHEYTHIAHLTRRSRNPLRRVLLRISPLDLGPLALESPRWVTEGYATYVEGRLTGSGRPNGVWRPAILRTWALDGQLPTYAQLDGDSRFEGGAMAYMVGSAFLQWLVARSGEPSLDHLWRRMSARRVRTFGDAFAGVFGGPPDALYGRFVAELTANALGTERALRSEQGFAPADSGFGSTVQRLSWRTGSPALSRDGSRIALVLSGRDEPARVVVWPTAPPPDTSAARARAVEQRLDPEDVPGIQWRPPARRALATLYPRAGSAFGEPRFLADGVHVLVVRDAGLADGRLQSDLYVWNTRTGAVRRVTHGAGIRHADPAPDGRTAVADRCREGICDLVRVNLTTGATRVLAAGAPDLVYDRPRWAPGGASIVTGVQVHGRWRVARLDTAAGATPHYLDPDDGVDRYDPSVLPDGHHVALISDAGGIPDVAILDADSGTIRTVTQVATAALAPEPDAADGSIYFLRLRPAGFDLDRIVPSQSARAPFATSPTMPPATQTGPLAHADTFTVRPVPRSRAYGLGPRHLRLLPSGVFDREGRSVGLALAGLDPVGRLTWLLQGSYGDHGAWRGASLSAAWRRHAPVIGGGLFYADERPSHQYPAPTAAAPLDADYAGGVLTITLDRLFLSRAQQLRAGVSAGSLRGPAPVRGERMLGFADYAFDALQTPGEWQFAEGFTLRGSVGRTVGRSWHRGIASVRFTIGRRDLAVEGDAAYGLIDRRSLPFEEFTVGGAAPPLLDGGLLPQRIAMPALPVGVATGRQVAMYRIALAGAGLEPYYWGAAAGGALRQWDRVAGLEVHLAADGLWALRLPGVRLTAGTAYVISGPERRTRHFYFALGYRP